MTEPLTKEPRAVIREGTLKSNLKEPPTTPRPPPPKAQVAPRPEEERVLMLEGGELMKAMAKKHDELSAEIERLTSERDNAERLANLRLGYKVQRDRLRAALERLGSMEAFVVSRAVTAHDAELIARIEYAQEALRGDAQQELCPHGFVLADNICGPCSEGRANRTAGGT